jgi:putative ABC transport system substrate-binding protein
MRRREFITLLGGAAVAWPLAVRAQQRAMLVVGFFSLGSPGAFADQLRALRTGLKGEGFEEGGNVAFDFRWLATGYGQARAAAAELVASRVDIIVTTTSAVLAAKAATRLRPVLSPVSIGPAPT